METDIDVDEYLQNPSMVRELCTKCRTAHAYLIQLEKKLANKINVEVELTLKCNEKTTKLRERDEVSKKLEQENQQLNFSSKGKDERIENMLQGEHQLQTKVVLLERRLEDSSRDSFLQFLVSLLATVLLGFGVNVVTTTPNNWMAWILIVMSLILSVVAFTFVRKNKK